MKAIQERIYLTDITLHVRDFRQTINFSRVAERGRMYSPLPKDYAKEFESGSSDFSMDIKLPKDLMDRVNAGEVELMMPKGGLLIYAGRDVYEKIEKREQDERRQLIHRSRTWHADEKGVV